ncbi:PSD1 and planctomycete cytochrome C domain-containing protein [Bythopirellula goksoeyrii]|uniref:Planctomycete cytochrome C n=1 Tax=Bythopirellula goksoeyrii TaxID=1400387 RepID=A0A5B9QK79_9BACT|nr:PSD1 and planctomycete cytochrome C domain-containing protein [Bythopirellula goksoeyrii]QEG37990.1 Planctomycete cytochrome C [Bythopirellula goksoeyrii]
MCRLVARILFVPCLVLNCGLGASADESSVGIELFENRIRPVLVESCFQCHSVDADEVEGELTLDNRAAVLRGGRSGAIITPGDPAASRLLRALRYDDPQLQMPPEGKLPEAVIADFERWIELGAPDPRDGSAATLETIASRAELHWAFKLPVRPALPDLENAWATNSLDKLISAELTRAGLSPAAQASRGELIRRLYFDLVGLPPSWEQVQAFEANDSPDAYHKLVDELLDSPKFGERWARHWLDVARFADTKGYVFTADRNFPNAYKYRDWVIGAFNDDLPIDQFMMYQIAADSLIKGDEERQHLAAQGYVTLGRRFINNPHDIIADRIDVVFRGMMGITVACARCHDHKFDPITDEDYYALYGMFASSEELQDEDLPLRLVDKAKPQNVGVFIRGNAQNRSKPIARGFPKFFTVSAQPVTSGSGRLELARAIASPENPLTARVFVNRVWGHLFGEQLVGTASDFGLRSDIPRQQAVLDLLATDFMSKGWSLKWLVRELVTSSTYRQSSQADPATLAADPENQLWGRMNRRRRDFEALRDGLLAVSGRLEERVGGESERIDTEEGGARRSLYAHIDRQNLPGVFRAFDFASPDTHSPERAHTLVPQQALFLLNNPMMQIVARDLVSHLTSDEPSERIAELYRRVLTREPSASEIEQALVFLNRGDPQPLPADEWSFGYGKIKLVSNRANVAIVPLAHFVENRWQAKNEFPEQEFGYVSVTPEGGHPGNKSDCCSIRRWTAPEGGKLLITGEIERPSENGDGIETTIVSSRLGVIASWIVEQGKKVTRVELPVVESDETIDFVVGCRGNAGWDTFQWKVALSLESGSGMQHWSSQQDFHGPQPEPLDLWTQFAQVLLVSNEFLFID